MGAHNCLQEEWRGIDLANIAEIEDPGDGMTIYLDRNRGVVPITSAAAETRTLAQPTRAGLEITLVLYEDGGDVTLTVTGGYNEDGDTSITLDDAGDMVRFMSIDVGGTYTWQLTAQRGTTAATEDLVADNATISALTLNSVSVVPGDMTPGTGISSVASAVCEHSVMKVGGLIKTEILIDLDGLHGGGTAGDIIGKDGGTANCHIGAIDADVNGTIIAGRVTCLEVPAGGDPDVDIWGTCTEATGAQDAAISGLTGESQLINHGDWAAGAVDELEAMPGEGYLYLTNGTATDAEYTTGILLIELWGTA